MSSGQGSAALGAASAGSDAAEPGPKRRRLLDAGGPIEDDETARQKMRNARVYERGVNGAWGEYVGFDPDNVADVKSHSPYDADMHASHAITAMGYFAWKGDLPMMRWLYVNGADTRDVDVDINFPMFRAAARGHFEVCKWLFDHGAAKDVKRRTRDRHDICASSPLSATFVSSFRDLSRWLILNGALCKDDDSGDLDVELMKRDLGVDYSRRGKEIDRRGKEIELLLEWATDLHRPRTSFLLFLSGALSHPKHGYSTRRTGSPVQLLAGKSGLRELIGDYVGCVRGREARIVRQLTEMLPRPAHL